MCAREVYLFLFLSVVGTILKVFPEFVTILLLLYVFCFCLFWPGVTWDLSLSTGIEPTFPALEGRVLTTGLPGKFRPTVSLTLGRFVRSVEMMILSLAL